MKAQFAKFTKRFSSPIAHYGGGAANVMQAYLIRIFDDDSKEKFGIGECMVQPGLSADYEDIAAYESKLHELCCNVSKGLPTDLMDFPSIMSGFENAIQDYSSGCVRKYYDSKYLEGAGIPTTGFISLSSSENVLTNVANYVKQGFTTLKLSMIEANVDAVLDIVKAIRAEYDVDALKLRLDVNGLLQPAQVIYLMKSLPEHSVQCIEQPISVGRWEEMAELCAKSPIPIALDEELAGIVNPMVMMQLIRSIKPHILTVKPSLCGGFSTAIHWLKMSAQFNIGCWIASAGESPLGLEALCQWTSMLQPRIDQELINLTPSTSFTIDGGNLYRIPNSLEIPQELIWQD